MYYYIPTVETKESSPVNLRLYHSLSSGLSSEFIDSHEELERAQKQAMKVINASENDSCGKSKVLEERKPKVNLIVVLKNTGLLSIRDQITLQHEKLGLTKRTSSW